MVKWSFKPTIQVPPPQVLKRDRNSIELVCTNEFLRRCRERRLGKCLPKSLLMSLPGSLPGSLPQFLCKYLPKCLVKFAWPHLLVFVAMGLSLHASIAKADDSSSAEPDEFSIQAGYILPSRISGMDQVMPIWGLRYGLPISIGVIEFEGVTAHAYGSDYYNLAGGIRANSPIFPGGNFIYFAGLDETIYRPSTKSQNLNHIGFHFGGGVMIKIVNSLAFRADARFINAPGSILGVEVGFVYRAF